MKKLLFVVLMAGLLFGAAWPVSFYRTVNGLRAAAADAQGTFIYSGNGLYLIGWPQGKGYAFSVLSQAGDVTSNLLKQANATGTTIFTMSDLVKWVEGQGWQRTLGEDLPPSIRQTLLGYTMAAVASGSRAFVTIMVFPAGALETNPFQAVKQ